MRSRRRRGPGGLRRAVDEALRDRVALTQAVAALGFLVSFLLAPGLFLRHPPFTPIPIRSGLPGLPAPADLIVLVALGALLLPVLSLRRPWRLALAWCALFAARAVWDASTWQPYFYQYFFTLLVLALAGSRRDDADDAPFLDAARLILASTYVWAGLHKLNHRFVHSGVADLLPWLAPWLPAASLPWLGLAMAAAETALGLGLLFPRSRRIATLGAVTMHVLLLAALGPWGQSHNRIVWPWNVAMILLLVLLFHRHAGTFPRPVGSPRARAAGAVVLVFFVLGPLVSFAGLWPAYFSFKLYSHDVHTGTIFITGRVLATLPAPAHAALVPAPVEDYVGYLMVLPWSERELGALLPPEPLVFREVTRRLCPHAPGPRDILLVLEDPPAVWTGTTRKTAVWCADLGAGAPAPR